MSQDKQTSKMTVFVTGSTGLVGNNLVRLLASQGHHVKALARNEEKARRLLGNLDVEIITGDMEDVDDFAPHLAGCDVLMHTAAYFREYFAPGEDHWGKLSWINIQGTLNILTAAEAQGVKKAIYISSSTTIGSNPDGSLSDEHTGPDHELMEKNLYARSKVVAEEGIDLWMKSHQMPVVFILPTSIWGPGDAAPTSVGQLVIDFLHRDLPVTPSGGFSLVDARDVAQAMVNAVEQGRNGERYIVNNRYYSIEEILHMVSDMTSVPVPPLKMPYALGMVVATVGEFVSRLTGSTPLVTRAAVVSLNAKREYTSAKAINELCFSPRPFEQTIRDEVQWFADNGYLRQEFKLELAGA